MSTEKPVTVTELKTFIDAVEFAADTDEWIPSERQWKRIRSMIDRLVDQPAAAAPAPAPERYVEPAPITYAQGGLTGGPPQAFAQMPQTMPRMPPAQLAGPFAQGGAAPVRTPDLDTSHGRPYESSFAG